MRALKKAGIFLSLLGIMLIQLGSAQAAMVSNSEILNKLDQTQIVDQFERQDVQKQLTDMGVDPVSALARVNRMTEQEVAELNGQLSHLPAGAGVSTVELLLIIILVILIF